MDLIIAANWKMHKTVKETEKFLEEFTKFENRFTGTGVVVCPPYTALSGAARILSNSPVFLGSQNMYPDNEGAYTGEVSPLMLKELGVSYVIIGHSERRMLMREDNQFINQKVRSALEHGLIPILCIGETGEERKAGKTEDVLKKQLTEGLAGVSPDPVKSLVIAYEPVWAIGTGQAAHPEDALETSRLIWKTLNQISGEIGSRSKILYGGSVNKGNIGQFVSTGEIRGALVGGASLQVESFASLIEAAREAVAG